MRRVTEQGQNEAEQRTELMADVNIRDITG
jgi:hypothetical protein